LKDKENQLRNECRHLAPGLAEMITCADVTSRETTLLETKKRLEEAEKKTQSNILPGNGSGEPDVLGPVGLLVEIKSEGRGVEEDILLQNVLSWQLSSILDVIVIETETKAYEFQQTFPRNSFMILDIIRDVPANWNQTVMGPGNPVYALSLLQFKRSDCAASIEKVFNRLLSNVIVVDDLPSATSFMRQHNANKGNSTCPTLLTRDGYRLLSTGIMGGDSNKVPESLRWKMGMAACPKLYRTQQELTLLPKLKKAIQETGVADRKKASHDHSKRVKQQEILESELKKLLHTQATIQQKLIALKRQYELQSQRAKNASSSWPTRTFQEIHQDVPANKRQRINE